MALPRISYQLLHESFAVYFLKIFCAPFVANLNTILQEHCSIYAVSSVAVLMTAFTAPERIPNEILKMKLYTKNLSISIPGISFRFGICFGEIVAAQLLLDNHTDTISKMPITVDNVEKRMASASYMKGYSFSPADTDAFKGLTAFPDASATPNAFRWAKHISALTGIM